jgi:lipopolysaccharide transport system permease protein
MKAIKAVWGFRGFIVSSVKREFQSKYSNSVLGATWTVLNPLAMIVIYTLIFSQVMRTKLPGVEGSFAYSIYLCSGLLTWGLFSEITGRALNVFTDYSNLIKKMSFPRLCLPVIVVATALLNFTIVLGIFTIFLIVSGNFPGTAYFSIFPVMAVQIAFSIGLGVSLGVINVFFRDVGHFFGICLQFWFWLTPIVYSVNILPEKARTLIEFNPMTSILAAYQNALVLGEWPDWQKLSIVALLSILLCVTAVHLFRKHSGDMVDEL